MSDAIHIEGWEALETLVEPARATIQAKYLLSTDICQKCGVVGRLYKHGAKKAEFWHTPHLGRPCRVQATLQRYKCRDCGETFVQQPAGIDETHRMTHWCADYVRSRCLRQTFTQIAEDIGCSEGTVRAITAIYAQARCAAYTPTIPRYLGIDETMLDGKMRMVLTDVSNRCPVDILPDYDKATLVRWLATHKPESSLVCVTTDMNQYYHAVIGDLFPGVPVVVDKFHLLKEANIGIENTRKRIQGTKSDKERRSWKRRRHQLLKRPDNLAEFQTLNLDGWLANEPQLALAYELKERLFNMYDLPKEAAHAEYDAYFADFPKELRLDFKALLSKLKNWRTQILAYFDYPISNGYTEAMNGVAKVKNRLGRGYSFDIIRARVLFSQDYERHDWPEADSPIIRKSLTRNQEEKCSSCGGTYPPEEMRITKVGVTAPIDDPVKNTELMCGECYVRFHTDGIHLKGKLLDPVSTR